MKEIALLLRRAQWQVVDSDTGSRMAAKLFFYLNKFTWCRHPASKYKTLNVIAREPRFLATKAIHEILFNIRGSYFESFTKSFSLKDMYKE